MAKLESEPKNAQENSYYYYVKQAAWMVGPGLVAYAAAPYLSLATREIFPTMYSVFVGTPSSVGYYATYVPAREFACTFVYNKGPMIAASVVPVVKVTKAVTSLAQDKVVQLAQNAYQFFFKTETKEIEPKEIPLSPHLAL